MEFQIIESRPIHPIAFLKCSFCKADSEISFPYLDIHACPVSELNVRCFSCQQVFKIKKNEISLVFSKKNDTSSDKKQRYGKPSSSPFGGRTGTDEKPLSLEYYDLLGIGPTSTPAQIKKAYYVMAIKYHPDKNQGDKDAEAKFKEISEAYQVLSDPQKRAYYNKHGRQINADSTGINPEEFFKAQFGGDKFADIIGEISIARDFKDAMNNMESGGQNDESLTAEQRVEIRTKRVEKLSSKLIDKLSLYSDAFPITENGEVPVGLSMEEISKELMESFKAISKIEAELLKLENHGPELLKAIGYTYTLKAYQSLAKHDLENVNVLKKAWGFGSRISGLVREKAHIVSETYGTIKTAVALQSSFSKLQEMEKKKEEERLSHGSQEAIELSPEELEMKQKLEADAATHGLEALWRGSKLEVESVLREVCEKVLEDSRVVKELRKRRCEAMVELGLIYQSVADSSSNNTTL